MASAESAPSAPRSRGRPLLETPGFSLWSFVVCGGFFGALWLLNALSAWQAFALHLVVLSLEAFAVFALDKRRARKNHRRVSEMNLVLLSVLGGALGGYTAMQVLRHKTQHMLFRVSLPASLFLHAVGFTAIALQA